MKLVRQPLPPPIRPELLREALGRFATGVTVVTVGGGVPHGMTANSFTSLSLDPPLVLVCVDREAVMHRVLNTAGHFGVSVLAAHQNGLARHFADPCRPLGAAQFDGVDWRPGPATGVPLIYGALAGFECRLWRRHEGGDHSIVIGLLVSVELAPAGRDRDALLFLGGHFRRLGAHDGHPAAPVR